MVSKNRAKTTRLSVWQRKIIHVDMDAFFAAIEQHDDPNLQGKPIVVGGDPTGRGVVSTCSYEARKFGIHSAMPASHAKRLCPEAIFIKPRIDRYREVSKQVMAVLRQHTPLVEQVSLDEAYLDVTQYRFGIDDPAMIATLIKQNIQALTHLTASAGVAPNMFLAKVASDMQKPDGLTVVMPDKIQQFLKDLPVRKIPGVGPVTETRLAQLNIETCGDLAGLSESFLHQQFGKTGIFLHKRSIGLDDRQVEPETERKQLSSEETFSQDVVNIMGLKEKIADFSKEVFEHLKKNGRMGKTVVLKVKYYDFEQITRSYTLNRLPTKWEEIYVVACELLERKTMAGKKPVRLIGLGLSGLKYLDEESEKPQQGELFENSLNF